MNTELHDRAKAVVDALGVVKDDPVCREAISVITALTAALGSATLQPRQSDTYERPVGKSPLLGMGYQRSTGDVLLEEVAKLLLSLSFGPMQGRKDERVHKALEAFMAERE